MIGKPVPSTSAVGAVLATSTGDQTLISSGPGAIYVYGYSIAVQTTAVTLVRLLSGSTVEVWRMSFSASSTTANSSGNVDRDTTVVTPPAYLFRTEVGLPLVYGKGNSSVTGAIQSYSLLYWTE